VYIIQWLDDTGRTSGVNIWITNDCHLLSVQSLIGKAVGLTEDTLKVVILWFSSAILVHIG